MQKSNPKSIFGRKTLSHRLKDDRLPHPPDHQILEIFPALLGRRQGDVPAEGEIIPLGVADVKREGTDITVVSWSRQLTVCLEAAEELAAEELAAEGISVEVVDPRTLQPLDTATICASVAKTGRLAVVHEAVQFGGFGGEVVAQVVEQAWGALKQPPLRIGAPFCPVPYSEPMERFVLPQKSRIVERLRGYLG